MRFNFKAKNQKGEIREGVIEASSEGAAIEVLQKNSLYPMVLKKEKSDNLRKAFLKYFESVRGEELVMFFRQLSIMIGAKVPIISALSSIREETGNQYFSRVIKDLINDIEDGASFSDTLSKYPNVFSPLSVNIIKAGEASGNLKRSIEYVANNIEKNYQLTSKIKGAMMYPSIIIVAFLIIGFLVMSFVIPKLTEIIKELEAEVPWYTKVVIATSDFMAAYWWAIGIGALGLVSGILYYIKTENGRKDWDQIKIKLPVVGKVFRNIYITRFAENFSVLLVGGIPIIKALTITSSVINNYVYEQILLKAAQEVKVGGEISSVFKKYPDIPPIVTQMVKIGEDSGQVDSVLNHIASFYEQQTDNITKNLATLIEPVLMIFIGIAVGVMAFAILMPIYNLTSNIK
ncbi:MAG: type II secretion system F family protein [Patescibacteria group bacterium]